MLVHPQTASPCIIEKLLLDWKRPIQPLCSQPIDSYRDADPCYLDYVSSATFYSLFAAELYISFVNYKGTKVICETIKHISIQREAEQNAVDITKRKHKRSRIYQSLATRH